MSVFSSIESVIKTIHSSWLDLLKPEINKPYFKNLMAFLINEQQSSEIFPPDHQVFSWTHLTDLNSVKVVIIGQDPYYGKGQAHGLAFSVLEPCKPPPSLVNIYRELTNDIEGFKTPDHGNLSKWAKQGVLMINAVLTVRSGFPNSHKDKGWEILTDVVIRYLNDKKNLVFILWGQYAQKKVELINSGNHLIIQCAHPAPQSANDGFFGSQCFSRANAYLELNGIVPIDWKDI